MGSVDIGAGNFCIKMRWKELLSMEIEEHSENKWLKSQSIETLEWREQLGDERNNLQ